MTDNAGGPLLPHPLPEHRLALLERITLALRAITRPVRQWSGWKRISQWEALQAIRNSASLRAASYLAAVSMVLILVAGTIVAGQLRSSVFESRRSAILSDAALRFSSAQSVFDQSTASIGDFFASLGGGHGSCFCAAVTLARSESNTED